MKLDTYQTQYTKILNGSQTNIRAKSIKFLEETIGRKLHEIRFGNDFLDITTKAQITKEK